VQTALAPAFKENLVKSLYKVLTAAAVTGGLVLIGTTFASGPGGLTLASISSAVTALPAKIATMVRAFWSSIFRLFMEFTKHASKQMAARKISEATVKKMLNDGKVINRNAGTATVQLGNTRVIVNTKTGKIITVTKAGGGGYAGGR
jgi:hypothetical protein